MNTELSATLKKLTGKDSCWWLNFVGEQMKKRCKPIRGSNGLYAADASKWSNDLGRMIWKLARPRMGSGDGNIAYARIFSLILTLWFCRICRAKSYDPRRNPKHRRQAMKVLVQHSQLLMSCVIDESKDHRLFPDQEWDCPYPASARFEPDEMENKREKFFNKKLNLRPCTKLAST